MTLHEPGIIHVWTFDQTEKWVDVLGQEHEIATIDRDYALSVLQFLYNNAARFRYVYHRQHPWRPRDGKNAAQWISSLPLTGALRERILSEAA